MFGVMNHLDVVLCANSVDARERGYHADADGKYAFAAPIQISEVVIVRDGTVGGRSTVDLVLKDLTGKTYVVAVTGRLLQALPL